MLWGCDDVKIWPRRSCHDAAQRRTSMALECDAELYILDDADGTNLTKRLSAYYYVKRPYPVWSQQRIGGWSSSQGTRGVLKHAASDMPVEAFG
jgi:hypothetical protein